jgi:hypothetical protein
MEDSNLKWRDAMSKERRSQLEEARRNEIAKHMAIVNNERIAPQLKTSSKRRLIELNVLDESGVLAD